MKQIYAQLYFKLNKTRMYINEPNIYTISSLPSSTFKVPYLIFSSASFCKKIIGNVGIKS